MPELYWCYICNRYHTTTSRIGAKHRNEKSNERSIMFTPKDPDEFIAPRSVDPESGEPLEYWCDQCDHFHKTTSKIGMEHMKMWEPGFEYRGRGFIESREPEPDEEEEAEAEMSNTVIRKVKVLQGMAKDIAEKQGLKPDDLVVLTVSIEKVVGDPVSFLLSEVQSSDQGKEAEG